jgi:hypothetical protein
MISFFYPHRSRILAPVPFQLFQPNGLGCMNFSCVLLSDKQRLAYCLAELPRNKLERHPAATLT